MTDCPIYLVLPGTVSAPSPMEDEGGCSGCACGYLQYESLIPHLKEIRDSLNLTDERSVDFEFKLREQIVEISRLFDIAAGVRSGFFSKAHYSTTKVVTSNGTRYLKVPDHVAGSLEVRNVEDVLLDPIYYEFRDNHLVYMPCTKHSTCGCTSTCGTRNYRKVQEWPDACYKIRAKWGSECADLAVQKAIRDYLIETYRMQDPVIQLANGLSIQRKFQVPHAWEVYIKNFTDKRKIFSNFAIA